MIFLKKNRYSSNYFKAYSFWKETLEGDKNYQATLKSLNLFSSGDTSLKGVIGNKIIDLDWVERVEKALPYIDKAIRESRSFIEQREEIVPIEKVKRVNTQSIRHLAQNTHMIAKVEENGEVLPDRILNIYYESSFAIYENRFLFTLLKSLVDFVEKRYLALKNKDEKIDINFNIQKELIRKDKTSRMNLDFEYKTDALLTFDVKDDTSRLSGFTRVLRIRSIIYDFYSLPLIKALSNTEPVKPPIIHTNLMTKNVNFRNCLELWDYIERYRGEGYKYVDKSFTGIMPNRIYHNLQDIFVFANFLSEITFNDELLKNYQRAYKAEQQQLAKLQAEAEDEKIKKAVHEGTKNITKTMQAKIDKQKASYEKRLKKEKVQRQKAVERLRQQRKKAEKRLTLQRERAVARMALQNDRAIARLELQKDRAVERYEKLLEKTKQDKLAMEKTNAKTKGQ